MLRLLGKMTKKIRVLIGQFLREYNRLEIKKRECNLTFDDKNFSFYYNKQKSLVNVLINKIVKMKEDK